MGDMSILVNSVLRHKPA